VSIIDETRFVERLQFFDGQRLFASDLQGLDEFNREMRRVHNQFLHAPGVGNGFAVTGKKGDREVTVGPGYAVDSLGHEIILTQTQTLPIPPVAGNKGKQVYYDLTVSYPDDSALEEAETREGICTGPGVIRLEEAPVFCWVELAGEQLAATKQKLKVHLETGVKIRLARIAVLNCQLHEDVSIAQRQNARPEVTPYIFSNTVALAALPHTKDSTIPGLGNAVEREIGRLKQDQQDLLGKFVTVLDSVTDPLLITGRVDTSSAEFLITPEYRAHLAGPRRFKLRTIKDLADPQSDVVEKDVAILDQFQITQAQRDSFEFLNISLLIGEDLRAKDLADDPDRPRTRTRLDELGRLISESWTVVWMGVE
jgi:hypothetical protein